MKGTFIPVKRVDGSIQEIEADQVMVDGVQAFVDYVNEFDSEIDFIEGRVHYTDWVKDGFGTLDAGLIEGKVCRITDLKFGTGVQVWAKQNTQLMLYALGLYQEYSYIFDLQEFILTVHQPRLDHIDSWTISTDDLLDWADNTARPAALAAQSEDAEFSPGDWCTKGFCSARYSCAARAQWASRLHLEDLESIDTAKSPDLLDGDEISRLLDAKPAAVSFWNDLEKHAESVLNGGGSVGHYVMDEGRSNRGWKDSERAVTELLEAGVGEDEMYTKKLITLPAAEKILGKKHEAITFNTHKPRGKPVMVVRSEARPGLVANILNDLESID